MPDQKYPHLWTSIYFWFIVLGIAVFKAATTTNKSKTALLSSGAAAVFCAAAFTEPVVEYLKLGDTSIQYGVAGLVALTGEHAMRLIVKFVSEPRAALDLWRAWKGGGDAK